MAGRRSSCSSGCSRPPCWSGRVFNYRDACGVDQRGLVALPRRRQEPAPDPHHRLRAVRPSIRRCSSPSSARAARLVTISTAHRPNTASVRGAVARIHGGAISAAAGRRYGVDVMTGPACHHGARRRVGIVCGVLDPRVARRHFRAADDLGFASGLCCPTPSRARSAFARMPTATRRHHGFCRWD